MAAVENNEVQQVSDSSCGNEAFEPSSPFKNDFAFLCNGLDSFLKSLKLDSESLKGPEASSNSRTCAVRADPEEPERPGVPPRPTKRPRTSVTSKSNTKVLLKDYDCPKPVTFFNQTIPVSSTQKFTRSIEFSQQRSSQASNCLSECRFPPKLRSLYNKGVHKEPEQTPEPEPPPIKTRRRRRRNRLSLSDHAFDNDDAHGRRNSLPTEEDLSSTYDKIFSFRKIPYVYRCSRGKSCESPSKCAQQAKSFSLYMEINSKPGTPLHPLVRENINCAVRESCIVDKLSASVAVTAVQCQNTPSSRLLIPVSYHMKDKIGRLKGIIPQAYPETEPDEQVRGVVNDLLDFVDRQMGFNAKVEYDPDMTLPSTENSMNEAPYQENVDCPKFSPDVLTDARETPERKRRRGKCKEQNKVLRELKKLMNISVTDETVEVTESSDSKCSEPSCLLGCVCGSVHEKYHAPPEHCGNVGCMFKCLCTDKTREMYLNLGDLSKEEKSWHQTVIRKRNNALEIKSGVDRTKRRKKMPSRYDNTVTGHVMNRCLDLNLRDEQSRGPTVLLKSTESKDSRTPTLTKTTRSVSLDSNKIQSAQNSCTKSAKEIANLVEETKRGSGLADKTGKPFKKNYQNKLMANNERRLHLTTTERVKTLSDVFIWCTIHHKYNCNCISWIIFGRENNLVSKPPGFNRFIAEKFLGTVSLEKNESDLRRVVWYDHAEYCARTAGPFMDYCNRNKDPIFKKKLSYLLKNKIVSFSNSFVKAEFVDTMTTKTSSDNHPFVPALVRKITRGVGDVVKCSSSNEPRSSNEPVDIGDRLVAPLKDQLFMPPDDLQWDSSEDEIVDKSDFLLDDDGSEFIPKPKKQVLQQRFCFSSVLTKAKSPPKEEVDPKPPCDDPLYDSDIELVEEPIETYSLSSSPEPDGGQRTFVDGGTLSDSSCDDGLSCLTYSTKSGSSERGIDNFSSANKFSVSIIADESDSFSSPTKLIIDESNDASTKPKKSLIDCASIHLLNDSPSDQSHFSEKTPTRSSPLPTRGKALITESENTQQIPVEDVEYPQKGLFCMSLPDLGYLEVKDSRPNNFIMADPSDLQGFRTFKNCKEASDFMSKMVSLCINPEFASSEWVMVTRGVLEKYQSKPFDRSHVGLQKKRKAENDLSQSEPETLQSKMKRRKSVKLELIAQEHGGVEKGLEKVLKTNLDIKVPRTSSNMADMQCNDIFQSSHLLLTGQESAADYVSPLSGSVKLSTSQPSSSVAAVKNLVGTFPNINEANSFIKKNYQSRVFVRPCVASTTQASGTIKTSGANQVAGKYVRLPMLNGPRVRGGVPPNKTVRTVLVRGTIAGQCSAAGSVLHIRPAFAGLKLSGGGVQTPTVGSIVSTTNAGVSKTQVDTTASSFNSSALYGAPVSSNGVSSGSDTPSSNQVRTPLTSFPIRSCPKGTIIVSGTSITNKVRQRESPPSVAANALGSLIAPCTNQVQNTTPTSDPPRISPISSVALTGSLGTMVATPVKILEPSVISVDSPTESEPASSDPRKVPGTFVIESFSASSPPSSIVVRHGRPILPKPVIQRVPPRRADVIVPRNDEFATLISPAPSDAQPTPKVVAPSEKIFNGVLLPKPDKKDIKGYICHKKPSSNSKYRSLLPKR